MKPPPFILPMTGSRLPRGSMLQTFRWRNLRARPRVSAAADDTPPRMAVIPLTKAHSHTPAPCAALRRAAAAAIRSGPLSQFALIVGRQRIAAR